MRALHPASSYTPSVRSLNRPRDARPRPFTATYTHQRAFRKMNWRVEKSGNFPGRRVLHSHHNRAHAVEPTLGVGQRCDATAVCSSVALCHRSRNGEEQTNENGYADSHTLNPSRQFYAPRHVGLSGRARFVANPEITSPRQRTALRR